MQRLIYDMYYADEITLEVCEKLLAQLSKSKTNRRYY
jgi:hypothetical protein